MKTAIEVLEGIINVDAPTAYDLVKQYGKHCAELALKDALNRAYLAPSDNFDDISEAIEGAAILTP